MKNQYQFIKQIGCGDHPIHLATRKEDKKHVAIKIIPFGAMDSSQKQKVVEEVNSLIEMKHSEHVVRYYNHYIDKQTSQLYLIMQYYEQGSLQSFLNERRMKNNQTGQIKYLDQRSIWDIFSKIATGLNSIHKGLYSSSKIHVIHRNIKPSNIFLDGQKIKIGDFGRIAKVSQQQDFTQTLNTNTYYLAPQQIQGHGCTQKTDIWSLGCLLYQLATLRHPFAAKQEFQVIKKIKELKIQSLPKHYSKQLERVITLCLCRNPSQRPSIEQIIYYPQVLTKIRQQSNLKSLNLIKKFRQGIAQRKKRLKDLEEEVKRLSLQVQQRDQSIGQQQHYLVMQKMHSIKEQSSSFGLINPSLLLRKSTN